MTALVKYEMMILLTEEFNDSELKTWAFNYVNTIRKFSACKATVISRGQRNFAYLIKNQKKGNYLQINFSSMPKYIKDLSDNLKLDSHVLRHLILKIKS